MSGLGAGIDSFYEYLLKVDAWTLVHTHSVMHLILQSDIFLRKFQLICELIWSSANCINLYVIIHEMRKIFLEARICIIFHMHTMLLYGNYLH